MCIFSSRDLDVVDSTGLAQEREEPDRLRELQDELNNLQEKHRQELERMEVGFFQMTNDIVELSFIPLPEVQPTDQFLSCRMRFLLRKQW